MYTFLTCTDYTNKFLFKSSSSSMPCPSHAMVTYMNSVLPFQTILGQIIKWITPSSDLSFLLLSMSSLAYPFSLRNHQHTWKNFSSLASLLACIEHVQTILNESLLNGTPKCSVLHTFLILSYYIHLNILISATLIFYVLFPYCPTLLYRSLLV